MGCIRNISEMRVKHKYKIAMLDMAERFGHTSYAKRLQVGALLFKNDSIISLGTNGQPPGWPSEVCEDEGGHTLPTVRHAEDACLQKLWNSHETAEGGIMFISHAPCLACAIKLVTAGVSEVVYRHDYRSAEGLEYLESKGVKVEQFKED
jgi:dCMP deaminase